MPVTALSRLFLIVSPAAEDGDEAGSDIPGNVFASALFRAYENKDLSALLMAVCDNSMFDLLRNSFLIPVRFNDKGVQNPILLTDEEGRFLEKKIPLILEKRYRKFQYIYELMARPSEYRMYMAEGFREKYGYDGPGQIETVKTGEYTGILLVFELPDYVEKTVQDTSVYTIVWEYLMRLQQRLPRAMMYYGVMDENGQERHTSKLGIFLPFTHFEHEMDKKIEEAVEIGSECRNEIIDKTKM